MKKNYFLTLLLAITFSASFSQNDLKVTLDNHIPGSTDKSTFSQMDIVIKNNGTVTIPSGDTLLLAVSYGTSVYSFKGFAAGYYSYHFLTAALAPGDTIHLTSVLVALNNYPTTQTLTNVCSFGYHKGTVDSDSTNNTSCYVWDVSLASLNEKGLENNVKVFASTSKLNLSSTSNEALNYSVYSVTGTLVTSGSFTSSKQVDLNVASGVYAVVVSNENESMTKKIAIQ